MANSTFQSDCILIGGDSGGPLFDLTGKLVGIHSRVGQQLQMNMHVPMSEFVKNWDAMMKSEFIGEGPFASKPVKGNGFLGLATDARPEGGLVVTKVGNKSPAEEAGVKEGDVLLKLNGTRSRNPRAASGTAQGNVRWRRNFARTRTRRQKTNPHIQSR
jgi:serine protease Do